MTLVIIMLIVMWNSIIQGVGSNDERNHAHGTDTMIDNILGFLEIIDTGSKGC